MENKIHKARRDDFRKRMAKGGVALFLGSNLLVRNDDVHYPFRQNSDFYYLTGFNEEDAILVLTQDFDRIYVHEKNSEKEIWDGPRLGVKESSVILGIAEAKDRRDFHKDLQTLFLDHSILYYHFGCDANFDQIIFKTLRELIQKNRKNIKVPQQIINSDFLLHKQRMIKNKDELQILENCASITQKGHERVMREARVGMHEYELAASLEYEFSKSNAKPAYPSIVASGGNSCILHYIKNNCTLQKGDLILVDAGAELEYLATDVTRCFPVGKKFTSLQKEIYEIVLAAQKKAIETAVAKSNLSEIHDQAVLVLIQGLLDLKVLRGNLAEHYEEAKHVEQEVVKSRDLSRLKDIPYKRFFMHQTSHWLGMDVHDVGVYYENNLPVSLKAGMLLTVEPGLYFSAKDVVKLDLNPEFSGIGIRIEDDIYISGNSNIVLTAGIPKEVSEIEAMRDV